MKFNMRNHFRQFSIAIGVQIDNLVRSNMILYIPQIDGQIVGRDKVFTVGARRQTLNVVGVTVLVDFDLSAFN